MGIKVTYPIGFTICNERIKTSRFELKTEMCGAFDMTKDAFDGLLMEISGNMHVLTYQFDNTSNF